MNTVGNSNVNALHSGKEDVVVVGKKRLVFFLFPSPFTTRVLQEKQPQKTSAACCDLKTNLRCTHARTRHKAPGNVGILLGPRLRVSSRSLDCRSCWNLAGVSGRLCQECWQFDTGLVCTVKASGEEGCSCCVSFATNSRGGTSGASQTKNISLYSMERRHTLAYWHSFSRAFLIAHKVSATVRDSNKYPICLLLCLKANQCIPIKIANTLMRL